MARDLLKLGTGGAMAAAAARHFVEALDTIEPLEAAAVVLENAIKQELGRPGAGKLYGTHRAAAPGAPPAPLTRQIQQSIGHRMIRRKSIRKPDKARVGTGHEAAPVLERGSIKGSRSHKKGVASSKRTVPPHPFMRPAFERVRGQMAQVFRVKMRAVGVRERRARAVIAAGEREAHDYLHALGLD